jgi:hypothetical protein
MSDIASPEHVRAQYETEDRQQGLPIVRNAS